MTASNTKEDDDDSDEEVFRDADKEQQKEKQKEKAERKKEAKSEALYDAIKVEPKYCKAENTVLWELASLCKHCHPTVCLWAESISQGKSIEYAGDPLLDFGLANFLDRVSYKNPKSSEQTEVFRKRMAAYEKPINLIDFGAGEVPEEHRKEEEFMYAYMKMRPALKRKDNKDAEEFGDEEDDPELEAFAAKEIMKKMKDQGGDSDVDDDEDMDDMLEEGESEIEEGSDFFDNEEDMEDVKLEKDSDDEASEEEKDYDSEVEYESEQEMSVQSESSEEQPKKKGQKNKKKDVFASYDEFAELLEADDLEPKGGMHEKRHYAKFKAANKRTK